jgi:hypothetical protein
MFIRKFTDDPGLDVLLQVEAVNILDLTPPESITAVGAGKVLLVGEFENGPYNVPTDVVSATDVQTTFGGLGYIGGALSQANNPCARIRYADDVIVGETWNGNGAVQLSGKKFSALQVCRVDTSVGSVAFTALPFLLGASAFRYVLAPGQIVSFDLGAGQVDATFDATAATVTGAGAGSPAGFVGGETLTLGFDDINVHPNFTVTFLAGDTTFALVAARINLYAGFNFADTDGGQLRLTGRQLGTGGQVRIIAGSAGVLAALNLTAGTTTGTGSKNLANIAAVTPAEVKAVIEAAIANTLVDTLPDGTLRVSATVASSITVGTHTTATALGFVVGATATASRPTSGLIPAGTIVHNSTPRATRTFVTTQDIVFSASGVTIGGVAASTAGPWSVPVRHATDDGSGIAAAAAYINTVSSTTPITAGSFSVINAQATSAALTETQIDAAYQTALNATLDPSSASSDVNIVYSARQSNAVRNALRANAIAASAGGCLGRIAIIRPPLGTPKAAAKSSTVAPGVGAYRDQRVIYVWPGANTTVPVIARVGLSGGVGFTADGSVDVGADGFLASIMSQQQPEQNPGEQTDYLVAVNGVDTQARAQSKVSPLLVDDYTAFKKAGICALRIDAGVPVFQSGVTSVDPTANPSLVNINRRRMADYVEDSIAIFAKRYGKKVNTQARRKAFAGQITSFLEGLLSSKQPAAQRIAGYTVDAVTPNTPETIAAGMFRVIVNVRTLSTMDFIVIQATVGTTVSVVEQLP